MKKMIIACLCACINIYSTALPDTFSRYPNGVFVETGSYLGEGITYALSAGFDEIHSIELSEKYYYICINLFFGLDNVFIHRGDSSTELSKVICDIKEPITFWLDGHYSSGDTAQGKKNTPLMEELEQIKNHPIKVHTILIDDIRCCGTEAFDFITLQEIIDKLLEINPNYELKFEDGFIPNDILIAFIPQESYVFR